MKRTQESPAGGEGWRKAAVADRLPLAEAGIIGLDNVITRYYIAPMKFRAAPRSSKDSDASFQALAKVFAALGDPGEMAAFLHDLCTPAELEAMADRWRVVPLLLQGVPYRQIHERTGVSVTTIGRVARTIEHGKGGYLAAVRLHYPHLAPSH